MRKVPTAPSRRLIGVRPGSNGGGYRRGVGILHDKAGGAGRAAGPHLHQRHPVRHARHRPPPARHRANQQCGRSCSAPPPIRRCRAPLSTLRCWWTCTTSSLEPQVMLRQIREALKPDGRLVLLEYRAEDPRVPIRPEHKMTVAEAKLEVEAEGFRAGLRQRRPAVAARPRLHRSVKPRRPRRSRNSIRDRRGYCLVTSTRSRPACRPCAPDLRPCAD